ncbi:hypothetical protein V9K97_10415 [Variovorax sp. CCNWLW186]|uniref:hypothetical protein n=1 Tax=Variovorax sp. CCNWLW186 TaxID=3127473 RepID=UPI0030785FE6
MYEIYLRSFLISAYQCASSQVAMLGATALLASSQLIRLTPGEDPTRAFIAAMAKDLEAPENADEKKSRRWLQSHAGSISQA